MTREEQEAFYAGYERGRACAEGFVGGVEERSAFFRGFECGRASAEGFEAVESYGEGS